MMLYDSFLVKMSYEAKVKAILDSLKHNAEKFEGTYLFLFFNNDFN